ncbi:MAG: hypothetical protein ACTSRZ_18535 [Promethearchaeota archaeon]
MIVDKYKRIFNKFSYNSRISTKSINKIIISKKILYIFIIWILFIIIVNNTCKIIYAFDFCTEIKPQNFAKIEIAPVKDEVMPISIESNASIDIFLYNKTEVGKYLAELPSIPIFSWKNQTSFSFNIDPMEICAYFNATYEEFQEDNKSIIMYFIVENNGVNNAKIVVRYDYESVVVNTIKDATNLFRLVFMIYLSIHLFLNSREMKRTKEIEKYNMLKGFGFTFLTGSIAYLSDILNTWIPRETHYPFYPSVKFYSTLFPTISLRFDQIIFLTLILISDIFMMFEIEKIIGRRKKPIMTILLGVSVIFNLFIFIIPSILDFSMLFYIVILSITICQIIVIYASVIKNSEGIIRYKSLAMLLGILIPVSMAFVGGILVPGHSSISYMISNILGIVSVFLIKFGLD